MSNFPLQICSRMMSPSVPAQPEGSDEFDDLLPAYADDSRSDAGVDAVAVPSQPENDKQLLQKPSCCRKLIHQFENELTFHPKLNPVSLRMMHQRINHQPLITRLSEVKRKVHPYDKNLTFSPKLNATSIKLAQQRAGKIHEVQARAANVAAIKVAEFYSEYTFKPAVLTRSIRIAERMDSNFLARQRQYLEKRKQITENHDTFPAKSKQNSPSSKPNQSPLSSTDSKLCNNNSSNTSIKSKQSGCLIQNENQPIVKHINSLKKFRKRSQTAPHLSFGSSPIKPNALLRQNSERLSIATNNEPQPIKKPQNKSSIDHYSGLLQSDFTKLNESERVRRIKVLAEKITRAKKVFQIKGGYRTVRKSLKSRGWVEIDHHNLPNKYTSIKKDNEHQSDSDNDDDDTNEIDSDVEEEESEEYAMLCRAVRNCDPNFIWTLKRCDVLYNYLKKDQTVNHFSGTFFTTKYGLCDSLKDLPWYNDIDPDAFFPRCFQIANEEDKETFIENFQITTAFNVLKLVACEMNYRLAEQFSLLSEVDNRPSILITSSSSPGQSTSSLSAPTTPMSKSTTPAHPRSASSASKKHQTIVPEELLCLAITAGESFLAGVTHDDIENSTTHLTKKLSRSEWCKLLTHYDMLTSCNGVLHCSSANATRTEELVLQLSDYCPQLAIDGVKNTWIIKPGALSRGRGIVCMNNLDDILRFIQPSILMKENRWVIQKYIERPLLIYSTKFDIRQWFLVTDWNPLTMWMYKDCYLRFSSQIFSLDKLDRSIHLCNNSVQKHFRVSQQRDNKLPSENMWDSNTFQTYLESINEGHKWKDVIYPGMRQAIINVLQVAQDRVIDRKNTFELFGADFIIAYDFIPWLIEVNCSPTMERNTTVTKRLCKNVMEDTIKVVVDRRSNKDCDTGQFELSYRQNKLDPPPYIGLQLQVEGCGIKSKSNKPRQYALSIPAVDLSQSFPFNSLTKVNNNNYY